MFRVNSPKSTRHGFLSVSVRTRTVFFPILSGMLLVSPALARSSHGHGLHMHGEGPDGFGARVDRHGSDAYLKAVSQENERLLGSKLRSICRDC
jgi:hypothetical protein